MNSESKISQSYLAPWVANPDSWNYDKFIEETISLMKNNLNNYHPIDNILIRMLADSMTTYIKCLKKLKTEGLVLYNSKGEISGRSPYINIQLATSKQIIKILKELQILPFRKRMTNLAIMI